MALKTGLEPPKELIAQREGSHHQPLWANRDAFASQHVSSHGPPKDTKTYFSLTN
jgi:hypothetical protein